MSREEEIQDRLDEIVIALEPFICERLALEAELRDLLAPETSFTFLYSRDGDFDESDLRWRAVQSKTLSEAAATMADFLERQSERYDWDAALLRVDSEADHGRAHVDLYALGESHPLYRYLP